MPLFVINVLTQQLAERPITPRAQESEKNTQMTKTNENTNKEVKGKPYL